MSDFGVDPKKPEEIETKAAGDVQESVETETKPAEEQGQEKVQTEGETIAVSKEQDETKEGEEEDDEPKAPGFASRGPMSYSSSGTSKPSKPGRPK
ncbi:hypothetical protein PM082_004511 [Marasmius tenuissimus]|nr:hypothetical protein PM082_004511 [Marasmius tenuissimus]